AARVAYLPSGGTLENAGHRVLETVSVFDTSSTEALSLAQRHLLVQPANPGGSSPVLELLVLRNGGRRTRVAPDSGHPSWRGALLAGALEVEVGESDVSGDAVVHGGDSIGVIAAI